MGEIIIKIPGEIKKIFNLEENSEDITTIIKNIEKNLKKSKCAEIAFSLIGKIEDKRNWKETKTEFYKNAY